MHRRPPPFRDAVGPVRIRHHRERLSVGDELVDEHLKALIMDVIVARPMDDEEVAFQVLGEVDGRTVLVSVLIVLGRPMNRSW